MRPHEIEAAPRRGGLRRNLRAEASTKPRVVLLRPRATPYDGLTMFERRADDVGPITPPLSSKWSVRAGMTCSRRFAGGRPSSRLALGIVFLLLLMP